MRTVPETPTRYHESFQAILSKMLMLTGRYRRVVEYERPERPETETLQWREHMRAHD
jgi:hypothetical protein